MKLPIIIYDNGDVVIFETIKDAESYLESIDVLENNYIAYDGDGFILDLKADKATKTKIFGIELVWLSKVTIEKKKSSESHIIELHQMLINVLKKINPSEEGLENAPFERVLEKIIGVIGYTK